MKRVFLCLLAFPFFAVAAFAQLAPFPGAAEVYNGTGATPSDSIIDASQFSGFPDICKQINNALLSYQALNPLPLTVTVDARSILPAIVGGVKQVITCSMNPFSGISPAPTGRLLLGGVVIPTAAQWTVPNRFWVEGNGLSGASAALQRNTIIQAGSGWATCPGITMTVNGVTGCPVVFIGLTTTGSSGIVPTLSDVFAAGITKLTVDCGTSSNCIGVGSAEVQEGGGVDTVAFTNQALACVDFDTTIAPSGTGGISNSFIRNVNCTFSNSAHAGVANGLDIHAVDGPAEISNTTVSVPGGPFSINDCLHLDGAPTNPPSFLNGANGAAVNFLHCEHAANGEVIGDVYPVAGVSVHGFTSSAFTVSHAGIWLKNALNSSVEGVSMETLASGAATIIDGTNSITSSSLAHYGEITLQSVNSLPSTAPNGTILYCVTCGTGSGCPSGSGALAVRQNGAWSCK